MIKRIISLLAAILMACAFSLPAFGASSVTYSADADKFIFAPGSEQSPTDLFTNYKGLMPGDSVIQDITVRNDASNGVKVNLFVRSRGALSGSEEFLSKLHLTVAKSENNVMAYMFDAAADETDGMTDWVYLGTLYSGGEVNLVLKLDIPLDLSDDFQDAMGSIEWEFKAEEMPIEPDDPEPPQTGDSSHLFIYIGLVCLSAFAIFFLIFKRSRQKEQD